MYGWNIWSGNATSEKKQYPYTMRRKKQYMFKYKIKLDLSISKVYLFCLILHFWRRHSSPVPGSPCLDKFIAHFFKHFVVFCSRTSTKNEERELEGRIRKTGDRTKKKVNEMNIFAVFEHERWVVRWEPE